MNILITGATGFIGTSLVKHLRNSNNKNIRVLSRNVSKSKNTDLFPNQIFYWDPDRGIIDPRSLTGVDVVIHLAGESIANRRWTANKKKLILASRMNGTRLLVESIAKTPKPPAKFITASAIGIYGDRGNEDLDEKQKVGTGYLAYVCKHWEKTLFNPPLVSTKTYCLRLGIVLGKEGGALKSMLPPFKACLGGKLGNGKQFMSWIHLHDLLRQIVFLINHDGKHSIYNAVSPFPCTNAFFVKTLAKVLKKPALMPIPAWLLKLLLGEKTQMILNSQKVKPRRFVEEGFNYKYPHLEDALRNILTDSAISTFV